jgi:hypothetical protein
MKTGQFSLLKDRTTAVPLVSSFIGVFTEECQYLLFYFLESPEVWNANTFTNHFLLAIVSKTSTITITIYICLINSGTTTICVQDHTGNCFSAKWLSVYLGLEMRNPFKIYAL